MKQAVCNEIHWWINNLFFFFNILICNHWSLSFFFHSWHHLFSFLKTYVDVKFCFIYKGGDGKRVALSCFQPRRVPIGFGVAPSGKALSIAPPAAFSRYKDLHRSLFSHCLLHLSSHISLPSPRSSSYRKGLRPPSCCLAGFYRPSPIALLGTLA